jgi:hypothetical protein
METFPSDRYFYALVLGGLIVLLVSLVIMMALGWDVFTITWMSISIGTLTGMFVFMWVLIKVMYGTENGSSS